jgi:hypothetical protein
MKVDIKIHPAANFLPELSSAEFQELRDDIKARGLLEPILVKDGHVIDGRHRLRACEQLGIEPTLQEYEGTDCIAEIVSRNLLRRHLTAKERAEIAAKLIPQIKNGEILSGPNEPESKRPAHRPNTGGRTVEKAAKNYGRECVQREASAAALEAIAKERNEARKDAYAFRNSLATLSAIHKSLSADKTS